VSELSQRSIPLGGLTTRVAAVISDHDNKNRSDRNRMTDAFRKYTSRPSPTPNIFSGWCIDLVHPSLEVTSGDLILRSAEA